MITWLRQNSGIDEYHIAKLGRINVATVGYDRYRSADIEEEWYVIVRLPGCPHRKRMCTTVDEAKAIAEKDIRRWVRGAGLVQKK